MGDLERAIRESWQWLEITGLYWKLSMRDEYREHTRGQLPGRMAWLKGR